MTKTISEHRLVEVLGKLSHEIITTLWPVEYLLLAFLFFFLCLHKHLGLLAKSLPNMLLLLLTPICLSDNHVPVMLMCTLR